VINSSSRVPGELLPICAPWRGNAGESLRPPATSGLGSPDGIGKFDLLGLSPIVQAYRRAQAEETAASMRGLGQADVGGAIAGGVLLYTLTYGLLGYFAGKAMAPSKTNERGYAIAGSLLAIFGGVLGLGAEGLYASSKK
jgi:hypothetical protein